MIVSASRRTDIPAFYSDWLFRRLEEGFAVSRNPMNPRQIRRVSLAPEDAGCIVFWTKNPAPMIPRLGRLAGRGFYFQFTITPYGRDVEPRLPCVGKAVDDFRRLADMLGPHRVIWRYDPVFAGASYDARRHADEFGAIARALRGYAEKAAFSFMEPYRSAARRMAAQRPVRLGAEERLGIAAALAAAARENSMALEACAQGADFSGLGIGRARCVDGALADRLAGRPLGAKKDRSQRPECGCAQSADIGAYGTCPGGCLYCYATRSHALALEKSRGHDASSPLLGGPAPPTKEGAAPAMEGAAMREGAAGKGPELPGGGQLGLF